MDLAADFDLAAHNTLGLPASARLGALISAPGQVALLAEAARSAGLPLHVIGGGSNLVLRDRIDAVIGVMATQGRTVRRDDEGNVLVTAQAGEDWSRFVDWTVAEGLAGLENLAGIPGTVGAAPVQNIGAYGVELADRFHSLTVWDISAQKHHIFTAKHCDFSYRQSVFKRSGGRYIVLDVTFALPRAWRPVLSYAGLDALPADADAMAIRDAVVAVRNAKLPDWHVIGNAGSFFHNPVVDPAVAQGIPGVPRYPQADGRTKLSAAWLIEASGLKGYRHGPAGIYDRHALIIVNHGGARYRDISELAAIVQRTVHDRFGVTLTQEPIEL